MQLSYRVRFTHPGFTQTRLFLAPMKEDTKRLVTNAENVKNMNMHKNSLLSSSLQPTTVYLSPYGE